MPNQLNKQLILKRCVFNLDISKLTNYLVKLARCFFSNDKNVIQNAPQFKLSVENDFLLLSAGTARREAYYSMNLCFFYSHR